MITKDDIHKFTFAEYRKVGTTKLSNEVLPIGEKVMTYEGQCTCAEESRLAVDVNGNVYLIADSHFRKAYEPAELPSASPASSQMREALEGLLAAYASFYAARCAMGSDGGWRTKFENQSVVIAARAALAAEGK